MRKTTAFRQLIASPEIVLLPGVHDVLSARIAEQAGFAAITTGGYSASATLLGQPDTSQLSLTEMADHYTRLCEAVSVPVFGDGDTGFGNVTNVVRTVRAYERAGLAGMFIEDQVFPKRCGHMAGKAVIEPVEMVAKLKAALDARVDPDFVIMARTDAIAVHGIDDAIARLELYRSAGVDMLFADGAEDVEQMRRLCAAFDAPVLANMIDGGVTPVLPLTELQALGFAAATYSLGATYVVARAMHDYMHHLAEHGTSAGYRANMLTFDDFNAMVGLGSLREREAACLDYAADLSGDRH